jgi:hypothetical protein
MNSRDMRTHPELVKDFEQLVEDWFHSEYPEGDWDLTTQEERIANYLRFAHPDDYPRRIEEAIKAIERHAE